MSPLVPLLLLLVTVHSNLACMASHHNPGNDLPAVAPNNPKDEPRDPSRLIGCNTCGDSIEVSHQEGATSIRVDKVGIDDRGCMTRRFGCDGIEEAHITQLTWNYGSLIPKERQDPKYVEQTLQCNDDGEWVFRANGKETIVYEVSCYSAIFESELRSGKEPNF
ncbi:hypothetical protein QR680_017092 [Steinernema hermaphroditum]|uniref:C6 domain-containing protein n=1 Tax=Steinernema hermaphroditum TaxID=289476 RepID=A0AA39LNM1_9BILA|nr:hypothetical protein QR680_017092 [Steinernema hermaphroditum]